MRLWGGRFGDEPDARMADFTRSIEVDAALALDDIAGLDRARARPRRGPGLADRGRGRSTSSAASSSLRGRRGRGRGRVGPGPRGRPHEPRDHAHRAGRAGRRQAPHRAVAQRPGRHGPAALDAPGGRTASTPAIVDLERALVGPRRARGRRRPARHDPHPAGPAGPVRPPPARLRRDAGARPRPPGGCPPPAQRLAARGRARWPGPATRSTARRPRAELGFDGVTANSLDAVSDRDFVVEVLAAVALGDGPPQPAGRGDHLVVEPALRVRRASPTRSRPAPR